MLLAAIFIAGVFISGATSREPVRLLEEKDLPGRY